MALAISAWIVGTAYTYVLCGRLLWQEVLAADRRLNPLQHAACPLAQAGNRQAAITRGVFVAFWPGFLGLAALSPRG